MHNTPSRRSLHATVTMLSSRAPLLLILVLISLYPMTASATDAGPYDGTSWQTMIAGDCVAYFDGCNNCRRAEGSQVAACTRKACASYQKPRCLDEPVMEGSVGETPFEGRLAEFACDGDNRFRVYYGEYVSGDQRVKLGEDELMLADEQTHTASRLVRQRAASGAKYSDGKLEFWEHGGEAMLRKDGAKMYQNCRPGS
jgi:membrane-bound inhibitor of C-type lysozyme